MPWELRGQYSKTFAISSKGCQKLHDVINEQSLGEVFPKSAPQTTDGPRD